MKEFEYPEIEILELIFDDILTVSGFGEPGEDEGEWA